MGTTLSAETLAREALIGPRMLGLANGSSPLANGIHEYGFFIINNNTLNIEIQCGIVFNSFVTKVIPQS